MKKSLETSLIAVTALACHLGTASAALLAYEGFDYADGTNFGTFGDADGGTGFGSPWYRSGGTASRLIATGNTSFTSVNVDRLSGFQGQHSAVQLDEIRTGDMPTRPLSVCPSPPPSLLSVSVSRD